MVLFAVKLGTFFCPHFVISWEKAPFVFVIKAG